MRSSQNNNHQHTPPKHFVRWNNGVCRGCVQIGEASVMHCRHIALSFRIDHAMQLQCTTATSCHPHCALTHIPITTQSTCSECTLCNDFRLHAPLRRDVCKAAVQQEPQNQSRFQRGYKMCGFGDSTLFSQFPDWARGTEMLERR